MAMLLNISIFEFRYLLRNPLLWVAMAVTFALIFIAMSVDGFELGSGGILLENAAYATLRNYLVISVLFMFVTTSFVADSVIRDDRTGFGPILRSTRITKFQYLIGRFLGAFAIAAVGLLVVPLAIWTGSMMPWVEVGTVGPNRIIDHLYGYFLLGFPNIFISSVILFALATITRSMMATYLGVLVLVGLFMFFGSFDGSSQAEFVVAIVEPFGGNALNETIRYWTIEERNVTLPSFTGSLLYNRILWTGISFFFLWLTYLTYRFSEQGMSKRKQKKQKLTQNISEEIPPTIKTTKLPSPQTGFGPKWALLWMRTKFEVIQVIVSPAFAILLTWGMFATFMVLLTQRDPEGRATHPTTLSLIPELIGAFDVILLIIAIYYSGELVWRERDRRINEIIDAAPIPNWGFVVPKTLAMALVLFFTLLMTVVASLIVQMWLGHYNVELEKYMLWYVIPLTWDMLLLAVAAIFVQALSPSKAVGWGIMVLILIAQQFNTSVDHNLLLYGESSIVPLSDMNGAGSFWIGAWIFRLYWGSFALLLLIIAHLFWRRGRDVRLKPRLIQSIHRLKGKTGLVAGIVLFFFLATGSYAYYNTNILNRYQTQTSIDEERAEFEKKYWKYHDLPQPSITDVTVNIALYPEERKAITKGTYVMTNQTQSPIREVHVLLEDPNLALIDATIEGARLVLDDTKFNYRIYKLDKPLRPGEELYLRFETLRWHKGFRNDGPNTRLIENGTFLTNNELMPVIGMSYKGLLRNPEKRTKLGLPAELSVPELEDIAATNTPALGYGWSTADITVSTSAAQTPIAPGRKISDFTKNGRRVARFVPDAPIHTFFSVQSARYEEKHRVYNGIDLSVYYHQDHPWNIDRMLDALEVSLDYYEKNFGPYQFDHVRIVEFPGYNSYAQAFAGTIPYSEASGFAADFTAPETIDYVTHTTSHELAHQYWPHQVVGAAMPGASLLSETLAQYASLMVAKRLDGENQIRSLLKFELDRYLSGRANTSAEEQPLVRVIDQDFVTYHKGALAMYLLQERIGEDAVNRALRSFLDKYKFKGPPYPRSLDLIEAFRAEAETAEEQQLISDLFERVTLYDLKVIEPTVRRRPDGKWDVKVPIYAEKHYDRKGTETDLTLSERIEIGLFTAEPGTLFFRGSDVILLERHNLKSGRQVIHFVTEKKPLFAGVDPYNYYIDRDSEDNLDLVLSEEP